MAAGRRPGPAGGREPRPRWCRAPPPWDPRPWILVRALDRWTYGGHSLWWVPRTYHHPRPQGLRAKRRCRGCARAHVGAVTVQEVGSAKAQGFLRRQAARAAAGQRTWCRRCQAAFDGVQCAAGHQPYCYTASMGAPMFPSDKVICATVRNRRGAHQRQGRQREEEHGAEEVSVSALLSAPAAAPVASGRVAMHVTRSEDPQCGLCGMCGRIRCQKPNACEFGRVALSGEVRTRTRSQ